MKYAIQLPSGMFAWFTPNGRGYERRTAVNEATLFDTVARAFEQGQDWSNEYRNAFNSGTTIVRVEEVKAPEQVVIRELSQPVTKGATQTQYAVRGTLARNLYRFDGAKIHVDNANYTKFDTLGDILEAAQGVGDDYGLFTLEIVAVDTIPGATTYNVTPVE